MFLRIGKCEDDKLCVPVYSERRVFFITKTLVWLIICVAVFLPVALISYRVLRPEAGMAMLLSESIFGCGVALKAGSRFEFLVIFVLAFAAIICSLMQIATVSG